MARLSFPLRAQPDTGRGALPFQPQVENDWMPHEIAQMEVLHSTALASEGEARVQAINELMVLNELKTFFPDGHVATPDEERVLDPEFRLKSNEKPPVAPSEQTTLIPPDGVDTILRVPDAVRARMRGEQDNDSLPNPDDRRIGQFSDPETSGAPETQRQAAISVYYTTGSDRRRVLDLIGASADGMTDFEIEQALDLKHQTASARRNDLMNDGWIKDSGRRRNTDSGRPATVWVLTETGRGEWRAA